MGRATGGGLKLCTQEPRGRPCVSLKRPLAVDLEVHTKMDVRSIQSPAIRVRYDLAPSWLVTAVLILEAAGAETWIF